MIRPLMLAPLLVALPLFAGPALAQSIAANPVPAQGTMPYVNVSVPTNFTEDVWIQAAEARPGEPVEIAIKLVGERQEGAETYVETTAELIKEGKKILRGSYHYVVREVP